MHPAGLNVALTERPRSPKSCRSYWAASLAKSTFRNRRHAGVRLWCETDPWFRANFQRSICSASAGQAILPDDLCIEMQSIACLSPCPIGNVWPIRRLHSARRTICNRCHDHHEGNSLTFDVV